jgi:hypothetical protein
MFSSPAGMRSPAPWSSAAVARSASTAREDGTNGGSCWGSELSNCGRKTAPKRRPSKHTHAHTRRRAKARQNAPHPKETNPSPRAFEEGFLPPPQLGPPLVSPGLLNPPRTTPPPPARTIDRVAFVWCGVEIGARPTNEYRGTGAGRVKVRCLWWTWWHGLEQASRDARTSQ